MSSKFLNANTDVTLSENSDRQIPSQKAVKTYVDNKTSVLATKGELTTGLSEKQDVISDLDTIRSGAAKGATALQSYTETDPTVPAHVKAITTANISSWNAKQPAGDYATKTEVEAKQDKLISGTNITIENNVISATGSGFAFEGTKAEFDAAVAAGTITEDSVSLITDDVSGDNVATKAELQAVDRSKADTSLSNTTPSKSFKEMSVGWGIPDYSAGVTISANTNFTCPADGVIAGEVSAATNGYCNIRINDILVEQVGSESGQRCRGPFYAQVKKGDVVYLFTTGNSGIPLSNFYPYTGVN